MSDLLKLSLAAAASAALAACGYAGEDEPNESGTNRLPETEPPLAARETTPESPQAGDTQAEAPEGELVDEPGTEEEETSEEEPHEDHEHDTNEEDEAEPGL